MVPETTVEMIIGLLSDLIGESSGLSEDTILFGEGGLLDSMGLVGLVLDVEELTGVEIANERAFSQRHSPFRTVGSLASYVEGLCNESP